MKISAIQSREVGDQIELSAMIDDFRLWYRFPADCPYRVSPNPFVAAAFFPAALTGETLHVDSDLGVSPKLKNGICKLQEIFRSWRKDLYPFEIESQVAEAEVTNGRVCAFFSGGIDGLYTLGLHEDEITDLVYINGFDFEMEQDEFERNLQRVRQQAKLYGKTVLPVETNFHEFNRLKSVSRPWTHGSCLASVALAVGFSKWYISSSYTYYDLRPWGSHPLTDRLWSTEGVEIVHDSAALGRAEKVREVVKKPEVLDNLVVCWDLSDANCGECSKCLRTMTTLAILRVNGSSFPRTMTPDEVASLSLAEIDSFNVHDNMALAKSENNPEMYRALAQIIKASPAKELVKSIDNLLFGGTLVRIIRRLLAFPKSS